MDRIGFVPPLRYGEIAQCKIHWDLDPRSQHTTYQAIVYLTDVTHERAPFCVVPSVLQDIDGWLARQPEGLDLSAADFSGEETVPILGRAGDLIIWNAKLPHGPGPNRASIPRVMQAVSMFPAPESGLPKPWFVNWTREEQVNWWLTKRAPPWWRNVPNQQDPEPGELAILTELGERLVGLKKWFT